MRLGVLFFLLFATAVVLRIPALSNRVFNSDEAYVATQAQALLHGARLYTDTVDRKPPALPYLYAAVFESTGSESLGPVHLLAAAALALTALLLAIEARARFAWRHAALTTGLLALAAVTALRPLDAQAAGFEVFALPTMTGAMLLAIRGRTGWSGLTLAVAALTLQAAAVVLMPLSWLAWRAGRRRGVATLAATFTLPIAGAALLFGWGPFVRWVFTSNGSYLDWHGGVGYLVRLAAAQTGWFLTGSAALVALAAFAWPRRHDDVELWLWLAAAVVPVVAGLRFFGHYYLELVPPLVLLATRGLTSSWLSTRGWVTVAVAGVTIASTAAFLGLAFVDGNTRDTRIALDVGRFLATHTTSGQRVLVWGQAPEAYWSSGRRPATRFATTGFLTGSTGGRPPAQVGPRFAVPGAWTDFLTDLRRHPPVLIADMSTADQRHAAQYPPRRYAQFASFLTRGHWRRVATVDGVAILGRTAGGRDPESGT